MSARAVAALVLALSLPAPVARADRGAATELARIRRELVTYEPDGGTLRALRDLNGIVARTLRGPTQREARYLRAVAATDLLLIARSRRDDGATRAVAAALGLAPDALVGALDRELADLEVGAFAEAARECRWSLAVLARRSADARTLREGHGARRDVLFVSAVVDALGRDDEIARLARLGAEPCGAEPCALAAFTAEGRRAASALREASLALARLERVAEGGDPFAASLAGVVAVDGAVLHTAELSLTPALPGWLGARAAGGGEPSRAALILVVRGDAIDYAYVPAARLRGGEVELVSPGEPALPSFASLPLADDGRAALAPLEALIAPLAALREPLGAEARVGIAAEDGVQAWTMSRVIVTMVRAGYAAPDLLARAGSGEARSLPVDLVMGQEAEADLAVFVRLGGYTLRDGHGARDIPRVRDASGLRFDVDALARSARPRRGARASLRYMGGVSWGAVLDAAFRLRAAPAPLGLVLY